MAERRSEPYIWATWLTKLLVGENSCEWAAWFKAHYRRTRDEEVPTTFDSTKWLLDHTALLNLIRSQLEQQGKTVFTESQNAFTLRGSTASLGGKPDLITTSGNTGTIYEAKTGRPSLSHDVQVMLYMYAVPRALQQYAGMTFEGKVVYEDHEVDIPASAVDDSFTNNLTHLIQRIAAASAARRVPSETECGFCNITSADCAERVVGDTMREGETSDF